MVVLVMTGDSRTRSGRQSVKAQDFIFYLSFDSLCVPSLGGPRTTQASTLNSAPIKLNNPEQLEFG